MRTPPRRPVPLSHPVSPRFPTFSRCSPLGWREHISARRCVRQIGMTRITRRARGRQETITAGEGSDVDFQ
eukprot:1193364-Prorocentrum_minimum.AAC.1